MAANHAVLPVGQGAGAANPAAHTGDNPAWLEPLPPRQGRVDEFSGVDEGTRLTRLSNKLNDKIKDQILCRTRREVFTNPRFFFIMMSGVHVQVIRKAPLDHTVRHMWISSTGIQSAECTDKSYVTGFVRFFQRGDCACFCLDLASCWHAATRGQPHPDFVCAFFWRLWVRKIKSEFGIAQGAFTPRDAPPNQWAEGVLAYFGGTRGPLGPARPVSAPLVQAPAAAAAQVLVVAAAQASVGVAAQASAVGAPLAGDQAADEATDVMDDQVAIVGDSSFEEHNGEGDNEDGEDDDPSYHHSSHDDDEDDEDEEGDDGEGSDEVDG